MHIVSSYSRVGRMVGRDLVRRGSRSRTRGVIHIVGSSEPPRCCRWLDCLEESASHYGPRDRRGQVLTVDLHAAEIGSVACHAAARVRRKGVDGGEKREHHGDEEDESRQVVHRDRV